MESVFRLGRSAPAVPDVRSHSDHEHATTVGDLPWSSGSESGLGPQSGDAIAPVTKPTTRRSSGPGSDGVDVIIAGWAKPPASPFAMADFTPVLTLDGIVVVLTGSTQDSSQALHAKQLSRAAALAGLLLTDRLILVHPPAVHRDAMRSRTIDFRRPPPYPHHRLGVPPLDPATASPPRLRPPYVTAVSWTPAPPLSPGRSSLPTPPLEKPPASRDDRDSANPSPANRRNASLTTCITG